MDYENKLEEIRDRLSKRKNGVREDYGVKGMKWGEHKTEDPGSATEERSGAKLEDLPKWKRESIEKGLSEGNTYTFANAFLELYPKEAEEAGFGMREAVNQYRSWIEYNDGIFTFRHPNGDKDFFDAKMRFKGRKRY